MASGLGRRLRAEWDRFRAAASGLDRQALFVLAATPILIELIDTFGHDRFYRARVAPHVGEAWREAMRWGWWNLVHGAFGFLLPALCLMGLFRRRPAEIGIGPGRWRVALGLTFAYLPLLLVGTWILSDQVAFRAQYPHLREAAFDWRVLAVYEALFLVHFIGWEYLWRGFLMFGVAPAFGVWAVVVQAVPFAILHLEKPLPEMVLSVPGGILIGAIVWRLRTFWVAVPLHWLQMASLDVWCSLRARTGVTGVGPGDLLELLRGPWS